MNSELSVTTEQGNQNPGFYGWATNLASLQAMLLKYLINIYLEERPGERAENIIAPNFFSIVLRNSVQP